MQLFFFPQCRVFQRAFARRQCAAVGPMYQSMGVQDLQIFSDGDLGSLKLRGEIGDQHASLAMERSEYGAAAFFVEQIGLGHDRKVFGVPFLLYRLVSFVQRRGSAARRSEAASYMRGGLL